jgi:NitT/TauT family transport system permease protein
MGDYVDEAARLPLMQRALARWNGLLLIVALLVAWQLLFEFAGEDAMAPPMATIGYLLHLLGTADFWSNMMATGIAFLFALVISLVLGLLIGLTLGLHRFSGEVAEPMLVSFYSVPKITLYPIVLLAFGIGMPAKVAFGAIHGIVPMAIFTMTAVGTVKPVLLKTAHVMRLTQWHVVRAIIIPSALPEIFTGIRVSFSLTLIGTLLGEMFGSQRGLGYLLMTAIGLQNVRMIMAVTLLLVVFAATVSVALLAVDRRLHREVG